MKSAVIYYSKSGVTAKIAAKIQEKTGADMYFIEPENAYGSYFSAILRVARESLTGKRAKLKTAVSDFSDYDVIFIGFPVWYGTVPHFLQDYIRGCKLGGKRIIPFATAGANGKASSLKTLKRLLPGSEITDYFYTNRSKRADADIWLDSLRGV